MSASTVISLFRAARPSLQCLSYRPYIDRFTRATGTAAARDKPRLQLSNQHVLVLSLRPSLDGKAWMITLYNPGDHDESTGLSWSGPVGAAHLSNTGESQLTPAGDKILVADQDVVTIRVEKS